MRLDAQVRSSGHDEGRLAADDDDNRLGVGGASDRVFCSKFITSEVGHQLARSEVDTIIGRGERCNQRHRRQGPKRQMAPTRRKEHAHLQQQQQQQQQRQQVSSDAGVQQQQSSANLIESSLSARDAAGSGADQMASLAQMSSYLMNSFHSHNQTFGQQAPGQSPLNGFMSAAALASVAAARHHHQQQQQQQRDLLLSQFASLHSLSAVASAIQQQSNFGPADNRSPSFSSCLSERLAQSLAGPAQPYRSLGPPPPSSQPSGPVSFPGAGFAPIPPATLVSSPSSHLTQYQQPRPPPPPGQRHLRPRRRGARKCRKMYGMAQRQLWCTQCKWKKACSRFLAQMVAGQATVSSSTSS